MGLEKLSSITKDQIAKAESRVGFTHPLLSVLESQAPQIADLLRKGRGISGNQEYQAYLSENMGFLADAIEEAGNFSLEPLELVSLWSRVIELFDSRYARYALSDMIVLSYAIYGLENLVWKGFPRYFLENSRLPPEVLADKEGLRHVRNRIGEISESREQLHIYLYGGKDLGPQRAADLAIEAQKGDEKANEQLRRLIAHDKEHSTSILREFGENFPSHHFFIIHEAIDEALGDS